MFTVTPLSFAECWPKLCRTVHIAHITARIVFRVRNGSCGTYFKAIPNVQSYCCNKDTEKLCLQLTLDLWHDRRGQLWPPLLQKPAMHCIGGQWKWAVSAFFNFLRQPQRHNGVSTKTDRCFSQPQRTTSTSTKPMKFTSFLQRWCSRLHAGDRMFCQLTCMTCPTPTTCDSHRAGVKSRRSPQSIWNSVSSSWPDAELFLFVCYVGRKDPCKRAMLVTLSVLNGCLSHGAPCRKNLWCVRRRRERHPDNFPTLPLYQKIQNTT